MPVIAGVKPEPSTEDAEITEIMKEIHVAGRLVGNVGPYMALMLLLLGGTAVDASAQADPPPAAAVPGAPPPASADDIYGDPSELSRATLVSEQRTIRPGEPFQIGLHIEVPEGWHTYWENPGDAGAQATLYWEELPEGFEVSSFHWPRPELYEVPPLLSFGYGEETLLLLDVQPPASLTPGERVTLEGVAEWLFCDEVCLFTDAPVSIEFEVSAGEPEPHPEWAARFAETRAMLPRDNPDWTFRAVHGDDGFLLSVTPQDGWSGDLSEAYFFARDALALRHTLRQPAIDGDAAADFGREAGGPVERALDGERVLFLERGPYLAETPGILEGILGLPAPTGEPGWDPDLEPVAVEVRAEVEEAAPGVLAALRPAELPSSADDLAPGATDRAGAGGIPALPLALGLAFIGGLLLNLMPCVFPVISLKILGFVNQAGEDIRLVRLHGLVFGAGVILSFLALAGILLAVRAAGSDAGWGFQLQDPRIVAGLAALLFLLGLNLLGVFQVGTSLTRLGAVGGGGGYRGSFLTGVLATIVATPCTAPFMGVAIGAAFVRPPVESLVIFGGLGLGMATPYMMLSTWPALLRRLPAPGRWMETFRQLMAFPMFAVALWLLWVFGLQTGMDGSTALLGGLLLLGLGAWVLGRWQSHGGRPLWVWPVALALFVSALGVGLYGAGMAPPATGIPDGDAEWGEFTTDRVAEYQSEGRAVFVDFTAAWCLSCQVNKRTVLSSTRIEQAFAEAGVALLRADWTRRDASIAAALDGLGRSGVPVYALYPPRPGAPPELLPEILTHQMIFRALDRLERTTAMQTGVR